MEQGKRSVVECWAAWCDGSRRMAPQMAELAAEFHGEVEFRRLDADLSPEQMEDYGIHTLPTLLFLRDGQETGRMVGERSAAEIRERLAKN
jgi:thioredoxin 1